jgi:hypothetical protein
MAVAVACPDKAVGAGEQGEDPALQRRGCREGGNTRSKAAVGATVALISIGFEAGSQLREDLSFGFVGKGIDFEFADSSPLWLSPRPVHFERALEQAKHQGGLVNLISKANHKPMASCPIGDFLRDRWRQRSVSSDNRRKSPCSCFCHGMLLGGLVFTFLPFCRVLIRLL